MATHGWIPDCENYLHVTRAPTERGIREARNVFISRLKLAIACGLIPQTNSRLPVLIVERSSMRPTLLVGCHECFGLIFSERTLLPPKAAAFGISRAPKPSSCMTDRWPRLFSLEAVLTNYTAKPWMWRPALASHNPTRSINRPNWVIGALVVVCSNFFYDFSMRSPYGVRELAPGFQPGETASWRPGGTFQIQVSAFLFRSKVQRDIFTASDRGAKRVLHARILFLAPGMTIAFPRIRPL